MTTRRHSGSVLATYAFVGDVEPIAAVVAVTAGIANGPRDPLSHRKRTTAVAIYFLHHTNTLVPCRVDRNTTKYTRPATRNACLPRMVGRGVPRKPLIVCRSLPQMVAIVRRTSTEPSAASSSNMTFRSSSGSPTAVKTLATAIFSHSPGDTRHTRSAESGSGRVELLGVEARDVLYGEGVCGLRVDYTTQTATSSCTSYYCQCFHSVHMWLPPSSCANGARDLPRPDYE